MADDHLPTIFDHIGNMPNRFFDSIKLIRNSLAGFINDESIATKGYYYAHGKFSLLAINIQWSIISCPLTADS